MATKKIIHLYITGKTLHCTVLHAETDYLLDPSDGTFKAAPAVPFSALAEDVTRKGEYALTESRDSWPDGLYRVVVREQAGASPAWTDEIVGQGELYIKDDAEVVLESDTSFLMACIKNAKAITKEGTVWYLIIYDGAGGPGMILKKPLKDRDGNNITDLEAGVLAKELASIV